MNPELIRLIESNGIQIHGDVEYFAELVAAAEREACASILDRNVAVCGTDSVMGDVLASNALAIRARGEQE